MNDSGIGKLRDIMRALRDPITGCPWDLQQEMTSLVRYTLEEAYEVVDAIERHDMQQLQEELGDLLFQIVFYTQIASERGLFSWENVVDGIAAKLVRRHPHVFPVEGQTASRDMDSIKSTWEALKAQEREGKGEARLLDDVPVALPALQRAQKIQSRLATVGFDWDAPEPVLEQTRQELNELAHAMQTGEPDAIAEELGDVLFSCVNVARHLQCDPEGALRMANDKVTSRVNWMEQQLSLSGEAIAGQPNDRLEHLWQQAKQALASKAG